MSFENRSKNTNGILVLLILSLFLSFFFKVKTESSSLDLSSSAPGGAAYDAIAQIYRETDNAIFAGRAIYESALPHILDFAQEALDFMNKNNNTFKTDVEGLSTNVTHDEYWENTNYNSLQKLTQSHYSGLLNNSSIKSSYESGLNLLTKDPAVQPYLSGFQVVR